VVESIPPKSSRTFANVEAAVIIADIVVDRIKHCICQLNEYERLFLDNSLLNKYRKANTNRTIYSSVNDLNRLLVSITACSASLR